MKNRLYVSTICILFVLCSLFFALFSSCRSKKNITRTENIEKRTERVETKTDTSRVVTKTQSDMEETLSVHETTERETIHFDTLGRVRTIIIEGIQSKTGQRRLYRGSGSTVSLSGLSTVIVSSSDSVSQRTEIDKSTTDSRPVQGAEWLWIVIGVGIFLIALMLFLFKKRYPVTHNS